MYLKSQRLVTRRCEDDEDIGVCVLAVFKSAPMFLASLAAASRKYKSSPSSKAGPSTAAPLSGSLAAAYGYLGQKRRQANQLAARSSKKLQNQRDRREDTRRMHEQIQESGLDAEACDKLVSSLLASPVGRKQVPKTAQILAEEVMSVKEEVAQSLGAVFDKMPERSRFRGSLVHHICSRKGRHFTVEEWEDICQVARGYARKERARADKRVERGAVAHPLFKESMRGFPAAPREATAAVEKEVVVDWARNAMVVRSGTHRETFRLQLHDSDSDSSESESSGDEDGFNGVDADGDELYEVDEIVGEEGEGDELQYLVYWRPRNRWPAPTWQHHSCMVGCEAVLAAWAAKSQ